MENYTLNTESQDIVSGINEVAAFSITDINLCKPGTIQVDASSALMQQYKDLCSAIEEEKVIRINGTSGYAQVIMQVKYTQYEIYYLASYSSNLRLLKFTIDIDAIRNAVSGMITCGEVIAVYEYNQIIS